MIKMLKTFFFSLWFLFHPVHVTFTSIDYDRERVTFKVFVRMYFDDFLRDCQLNGNEILNNDFSDDDPSSMKTMEKYLGEKVILKVNEKQLSGKLLAMKLADNEISMNLYYKAEKKPKTISVNNSIMTSLYNDQSNMIIIKVNDFEEGVKLTSNLTEQTFIIK
jgi:hypothetical protein